MKDSSNTSPQSNSQVINNSSNNALNQNNITQNDSIENNESNQTLDILPIYFKYPITNSSFILPLENSTFNIGEKVNYSFVFYDYNLSLNQTANVKGYIDRINDSLEKVELFSQDISPTPINGSIIMLGYLNNSLNQSVSLEYGGATYNLIIIINDSINPEFEARLSFSLYEENSEEIIIEEKNPRLLVLTDIGGDSDDNQSLVRLLMYSNDFDIEGLIASSSGTLGELGSPITRTDLITSRINAYGEVLSNLSLHDPNYPTKEYLLSITKSGNPNRGINYIGAGNDTEGSELIISAADKNDTRPLNIAIWGGQTDLAQALYKVKSQRTQIEYDKFISKLRIYDIADQDSLYNYILTEHTYLFYILNNATNGEDKRNAVFRGMYLGGNESLTSLPWVQNYISQNHGALGNTYTDSGLWTDPNPYGSLKEGDTPSFYYFLNNGLNSIANPNYGGWGGRFIREEDNVFRDAKDSVDTTTDGRATVWRFRPIFQNDFAARMDWSTNSFENANHQPIAALNLDTTKDILRITKNSNEQIELSAVNSIDPDGDTLSYKWWTYKEAGTYSGTVTLSSTNEINTSFTTPIVPSPTSIHVILEVSDSGIPKLTSYRRAIIEVNP